VYFGWQAACGRAEGRNVLKQQGAVGRPKSQTGFVRAGSMRRARVPISFTRSRESFMNQRIALGLTLLAGVGIGATAIQGLHAQAKPPTYVVVAIRSISDADVYKSVIEKAPAANDAFGGKFVIRTDKITSFDGTPPKRFILLAFDSPERAQAWHNSAAQKEVDALRLKSSDSLSFLVEGMAN
jgi:uncharacterized protein (DUF1330 family)